MIAEHKEVMNIGSDLNGKLIRQVDSEKQILCDIMSGQPSTLT